MSKEAAPTDIPSMTVDSAAEEISRSSSSVTAQDEKEFFKNSATENDLKYNQQNLGVLGKFFGTNTMAPTYIAGVVILSCIVMLAVTFFFPVPDVTEARKIVVSIMTSAMAFIFGASSARR